MGKVITMNDRLKKLRKNHELKQRQVSKQLGISESYYCLIENGNRRSHMNLALDIINLFNKTLDNIFLPLYFA